MRAAPASLACIGALLTLVPGAQAAQRYAAPNGSGPKAECPQANPCSLQDAVEGAKANDEVIIASGAYTPAGNVFLPFEASGVNIHGDPSGPPPTITSSATTYALGVFGQNSKLSYVDVTDLAEASAAISCGIEVSVERVRATARSKYGIGLQQGNCAVRDSMIRAEGSEAVGLQTSCEGPRVARNLTVVATGSKSVGAVVAYDGLPLGGNCTLLLRNSIVSGDLYDLDLYFGGIGPGNVSADHSNFDVFNQAPGTAFTQGPGNQTAPPLFVDAAAGNYREAAGSPTIDAGTSEGTSATDLDGNPRVLGLAPDIGAFEFIPPAAVPPAPGQIQSLSLAPRRFRAVNAGEAIFSAKKKKKAPIGTTVTYSISAAGPVAFSVERKLPGRNVGNRCVKQTRANRTKKKCSRLKPVKGSFTHSGQAGSNSFKFSGRIAGKGLKPGSYRLVGKTGSVSKAASFKIVR
jgi:hypothetical protein